MKRTILLASMALILCVVVARPTPNGTSASGDLSAAVDDFDLLVINGSYFQLKTRGEWEKMSLEQVTAYFFNIVVQGKQ